MFLDDKSALGEGKPKEQKKNKAANQEAQVKKPASLIYCGPNLPGGALAQYTVYRGGLPSYLDKHIEKCPAIRRLFVAPEQLDKAVQAIKKAGTSESVWNKEILDYIKGGVK